MVKNKECGNSSSSEDETFRNNVKEAIDQQFLNDDIYKKEETEALQSRPEINKLHRKSLRTNAEQEDNSNISTTFQDFIAKKLDKILEGTIRLKDNKNMECCLKRKENNSLGIKLLSSSKTFVIPEITEELPQRKKKFKRKKCEILEDDDASTKFQEAAVDPEYILSKLDTKAWVNVRPEPDFKYKRLKNGVLVEQV